MKQFEEPEISIIKFEIEDILTTSGTGEDLDLPLGPGGLPIL